MTLRLTDPLALLDPLDSTPTFFHSTNESAIAIDCRVLSRSVLIRYWLPVALWMAVIFTASTGSFSAQNTSRFIGPFLRWFAPTLTDATVYQVQFAVRKTGHAVEYAILAALLWRALHRPHPSTSSPQRSPCRCAALALACCATYAATDELHQHFVSTRQASGADVLLDTAGATAGLLLIQARRHLRPKRPPPTE